jgi:hypothetical protein
MEQVNINVTKVEKEVTINATPNVTQIIVTTQNGDGGGIPDAPNNSNAYVRSALSWVVGYTKTAIDNLLNGKVDKVNGKSLIDDTEISRLASMTAIFTTSLKSAYDGAFSWITTNGTNVLNHIASTSNPHNVTKSQVGLSNVDNTSDLNKPISTATQTQLNLKSDKSTTPIILKNNFTPNTLTAPVTTEAIVDNYDLGVGFLAVGESLSFEAVITKNTSVNGTIQSFLYLSKVSNSISVTDAVKIATSSGLGAGGGSVPFDRVFHRRTSSILSCRIAGTTAASTDFGSLNNIAQNIINDVNLNDYRFLIVASTYTGTTGPNTMQTNIILTKNPVV